jgi:hypothetical protein
LKGVPTVSAELQHATVKTQVGVRVRGFKIEVVPECQTRAEHLEKTEVW